jgi:hypothetical protein
LKDQKIQTNASHESLKLIKDFIENQLRNMKSELNTNYVAPAKLHHSSDNYQFADHNPYGDIPSTQTNPFHRFTNYIYPKSENNSLSTFITNPPNRYSSDINSTIYENSNSLISNKNLNINSNYASNNIKDEEVIEIEDDTTCNLIFIKKVSIVNEK